MLPQVTLTFLLALALIEAVPPPGYKKKHEAPDEDPPKYEYEYAIQSGKGTGQGKSESRDGIFASGRYYVQGKNSSQNVEYVADDWGYHPYVEYSNVGPHSKFVTQIALDAEAVKALRSKGTKIPDTIDVSARPRGNDLLSSANQESLGQISFDQQAQNANNQGISQRPQPVIHQQQQENHHHSYVINHGSSAKAPKKEQHVNVEQQSKLANAYVHQNQQNNLGNNGVRQENNLHENQQQQQNILPNNAVHQQNIVYLQQDQHQQNVLENSAVHQGSAVYLQQNQQQEQQSSLENSAVQQTAGYLHQNQQANSVARQENVGYLYQNQQHQQNNLENSAVQQIQQNQQQNMLASSAVQQDNDHYLYQNQQQSNLETSAIQENQNQQEQQQNIDYLHQNQQQQQTNVENSAVHQIQQQQNLVANNAVQHDKVVYLQQNQQQQQNVAHQENSIYLQQDQQQYQQQQQQQIVILEQNYNPIQPQPLVAQTNHQNQGVPNLEQQAQILSQGGVVVLQNLSNHANNIGLQQFEETAQPQPLFVLQNNNQQQFETAALYENTNNRVIAQNSFNNYDESALNIEHAGGYGSKINVKVLHNAGDVSQNLGNLVTGQDVLNINRAISYETSKVETSTGATAIVSEYGPSSSSSTETAAVSSTENLQVLSKQPIVVEDLDNYSESSVKSSTQNYLEEKVVPISSRPEIAITPRPVSSKFLAPITAAVQLESAKNENFVVDVQKSIPYYLGKIEYYHQTNEAQANEPNITVSATQNIQLGGFLQHPVQEKRPKAPKFSQTLTSPDNDQVPEGQQEIAVVDKPAEVKYVDRPYPVEVPVPVRVEVERVVEKPITHIVEKEVEKRVEVPVEVTRYIDRPYPVPVAVPKPVPYPVEVEKIVERFVQQPYPVEVRVPVQVTVEKRIPVPQYIEKHVPVEKIVEKQVPQYIPKPYPVPVKVPVPVAQAFYIPVEVPKPYPVQITKYVNKPYAVPRPYPVQVTQTIEVPISQPVPVEVRVPHPVPVEVPKYINRVVDRPYPVFFNQPYLKQHKHPVNNYQEPLQSSASYQSNIRAPCVDLRLLGIQKPYCTINNNYIGLVPPQPPVYYQNVTAAIGKQRKARQNFDNSNVRLEYGFMPPLIPSLEIDEQGNPVEKHTK